MAGSQGEITSRCTQINMCVKLCTFMCNVLTGRGAWRALLNLCFTVFKLEVIGMEESPAVFTICFVCIFDKKLGISVSLKRCFAHCANSGVFCSLSAVDTKKT